MNVSAVSGSDLQTLLHQRYSDFNTLQSALQSGNITSAQSAFASFQQDIQKASQAGDANALFSPGSQPAKDLQTLGNALKSADLGGATHAFAALKQDLQSARPSVTASEFHANRPHIQSQALIAANGVTSLATNLDAAASAQAAGSILNLNI